MESWYEIRRQGADIWNSSGVRRNGAQKIREVEVTEEPLERINRWVECGMLSHDELLEPEEMACNPIDEGEWN